MKLINGIINWLRGDTRLFKENKRLRASVREHKRVAEYYRKEYNAMNDAFRERAARCSYASAILDGFIDVPKRN